MPVSSPSYFPPNRADGTIVGITAGTNATGSRCFLAMKGAGLGSAANDLIIIGDSSCNTGFFQGFQDTIIVLGNNVLGTTALDSPPVLTPSIVIGHNTLAAAQAGFMNNNIWLGCNTATNWPADPTGFADNTGNIIIGHASLSGLAGNNDEIKDTTLIGNQIYNTFDTSVVGCTAVGANILKGSIGSKTLPIGAFTLVGANIFTNITGSCSGAVNIVAIGDQIAQSVNLSFATIKDLVIIGSQALTAFTATTDLVVIGSRAAQSLTSGVRQVLIGSQVAPALTNGASNILIGYQAGAALSTGSLNTLIGTSVASTLTGNTNVVIGSSAGASLTGAGGCVIIGQGTSAFSTASGLIQIGQGSIIHGSGAQGIMIGASAGNDGVTAPNVTFPLFFVGTGNGVFLYGNLASGNLLLGTASAAQREFAGTGATNILKLITGTAGGSSPNGGGYFYVAGTNNSIHWVNSAGVDSVLSDAATLSNLTLTTTASTAGAGQVSLGATVAATATLGANGAPPAQVAGYLIINVAGTAQKIPYYNA